MAVLHLVEHVVDGKVCGTTIYVGLLAEVEKAVFVEDVFEPGGQNLEVDFGQFRLESKGTLVGEERGGRFVWFSDEKHASNGAVEGTVTRQKPQGAKSC